MSTPKTPLVALAILALAAGLCVAAVDEEARSILEESGVTAGLVVHLGVGDGELAAALRADGDYLVQGLAVDRETVRRARGAIREQGVYGSVSVRRFDGRHLPYVDNLVNLLVVGDQFEVTREEMLRVLAPGGVLVDLTEEPFRITGKRWPGDIDDWTHFLHGPDNNARSDDERVGPPTSIQWVAGPKWMRSHEQLASVSAVAVAHGRLFTIVDEAPLDSVRFPAQWKLVARDAFNGRLLWKRDVGPWVDHLRHFRSGPAHLPRRLTAVEDRVYVTLGLAAPVSVLDADTGETVRVLSGTEYAEEISVVGGRLYLAVGTSEVHRRGGGLSERGEPGPSDFRCIMALDRGSGKLLWRKDFGEDNALLPLTMTVRNGRVFYQDLDGVGALDAGTGEELWKTPRPTMARRMSFSAPTVVATDEVLLCADRRPKEDSDDPQFAPADDRVEWGVHGWSTNGFSRNWRSELTAYDAATGEELWSQPAQELYNAAVDVMVMEDLVYTNRGAFDLKTGQPVSLPRGRSIGLKAGTHHRCYRNKAAGDEVFIGGAGIDTRNLTTGDMIRNSWIRGSCQLGIVPANGMLYAPPHPCGCAQMVKLNGFIATVPGRPEPPPVRERYERGGARPEADGAAPKGSWPMHRADSSRRSFVETAIPGELRKMWSVKLPRNAAQPVVVGDAVFVAVSDEHTVYALDAADGSVKWTHTAGARVDSSPTFYRGTVIFGSMDGRVTCLRATDGELIWRFCAAPAERLVSIHGQLESLWPAHGSVLAQNGALYVTAGRNSFLDGGIVLYKLDPATGAILAKHVESNVDAATGRQLGRSALCDMDGVSHDLLSGDGRTVFLKHLCYDADLRKLDERVPHLVPIHGFLEEEWFVRSYWFLGTDVAGGWRGWHSSWRETVCGRILCFDDESVYGYGREHVSGSRRSQHEDSYHLFRSPKTMVKTTGSFNWDERRKQGLPKAPKPTWSDTDSLIVRAVALTPGKLIVAGAVDRRERLSGVLAYEDPEAALASIKGEYGVYLQLVSPESGESISQVELDAMPVHDGLSAAHGSVFISLENGTVERWGR